MAINGDQVTETKSKKNLQIRDLTGAGDLFASGFLHEFIRGSSTQKCLQNGTEMSAKIIQIVGARLK